MNGPRLTLASLLGIVAVAALGMAGIRSATTLWTSAASTLTLGLFLGAILGSRLLRGSEQAFCLGFALFGIVYLVLVNWDWVGAQFGHDLTAGLGDLADSLVPMPAVATPAIVTGLPPYVPTELLAARGPGGKLPPDQPADPGLALRSGRRLTWRCSSQDVPGPGRRVIHRRCRATGATRYFARPT